MSQPSPTLEVKGVSAGYQGRTILREVTVEIHRGESVALIGPNGCGKSTLLRVISGVLRESNGSILLNGRDLTLLEADGRTRIGIGYLKQTKNVFTGLTVEENLKLARGAVDGKVASVSRIQKLINAFPVLAESYGKRAGLLSGGQRQALATAMVLMRSPEILLLDEPVAGLSAEAGMRLLGALAELRVEEGFATVVVEHRLRQIQPHVNRVLVMREGEIVDDTPDTERMLDAAWLTGHYVNGQRGNEP